MLENGGFLIVLTYPDSEKGFCLKAACVPAEQNLIRMFGVMDGSDTSAADIASLNTYVTAFVQIFVDQENTIHIYISCYCDGDTAVKCEDMSLIMHCENDCGSIVWKTRHCYCPLYKFTHT